MKPIRWGVLSTANIARLVIGANRGSEVTRFVRRSPALGGGALYDLGCYCVSAARLFGGHPTRVWPSRSWTLRPDPTAASTCAWPPPCGCPTRCWPCSTSAWT